MSREAPPKAETPVEAPAAAAPEAPAAAAEIAAPTPELQVLQQTDQYARFAERFTSVPQLELKQDLIKQVESITKPSDAPTTPTDEKQKTNENVTDIKKDGVEALKGLSEIFGNNIEKIMQILKDWLNTFGGGLLGEDGKKESQQKVEVKEMQNYDEMFGRVGTQNIKRELLEGNKIKLTSQTDNMQISMPTDGTAIYKGDILTIITPVETIYMQGVNLNNIAPPAPTSEDTPAPAPNNPLSELIKGESIHLNKGTDLFKLAKGASFNIYEAKPGKGMTSGESLFGKLPGIEAKDRGAMIDSESAKNLIRTPKGNEHTLKATEPVDFKMPANGSVETKNGITTITTTNKYGQENVITLKVTTGKINSGAKEGDTLFKLAANKSVTISETVNMKPVNNFDITQISEKEVPKKK